MLTLVTAASPQSIDLLDVVYYLLFCDLINAFLQLGSFGHPHLATLCS